MKVFLQRLYNHVPIPTAGFSFRVLSANLTRTVRCNFGVACSLNNRVLFLTSPSSAPPYLYRVFYRKTKKRIDLSYDQHLLTWSPNVSYVCHFHSVTFKKHHFPLSNNQIDDGSPKTRNDGIRMTFKKTSHESPTPSSQTHTK